MLANKRWKGRLTFVWLCVICADAQLLVGKSHLQTPITSSQCSQVSQFRTASTKRTKGLGFLPTAWSDFWSANYQSTHGNTFKFIFFKFSIDFLIADNIQGPLGICKQWQERKQIGKECNGTFKHLKGILHHWVQQIYRSRPDFRPAALQCRLRVWALFPLQVSAQQVLSLKCDVIKFSA